MSPAEQGLIDAARGVQQYAYAPYSNFAVGCAVRSVTGDIWLGCNVENASYGLTICAERVAIASMVAAGQREIAALVVVSPGGVTPCGACRQFMVEFGDSYPVLLYDTVSERLTARLLPSELLPGAFSLKR